MKNTHLQSVSGGSYTQKKCIWFPCTDLACFSSTMLQSSLVENALTCTGSRLQRCKAETPSQLIVSVELFKRMKFIYSDFMTFMAVLWYWLLLSVEPQQTHLTQLQPVFSHRGEKKTVTSWSDLWVFWPKPGYGHTARRKVLRVEWVNH